jgi:hypothetical protein
MQNTSLVPDLEQQLRTAEQNVKLHEEIDLAEYDGNVIIPRPCKGEAHRLELGNLQCPTTAPLRRTESDVRS